MSIVSEFKLVTKADAAEVFGVCVKSIDNYIREGRLPAPVQFASKEYWHPEDFREFLDRTFRRTPPGLADSGPLGQACESSEQESPARKPQQSGAKDSSSTVRQRARQSARVRQLNAES